MIQRNRKKRPLLFNPDELNKHLAHHLQSDIHHESKTIVGRREFEIFASLQSSAHSKKYRPQTASSAPGVAALDKFRFILEHVRESQRFLRCPSEGYLRTHPEADRLVKAMIRARSLIHNILGEFSHEEWFRETKHGIGASVGVGFQNSGLAAKFRMPATITEECLTVAKYYLKWDPTLVGALYAEFPDISLPDGAFQVVHGSRLTTVPKTIEIDRTIAVEPTWNMFFQQGLMAVLVRRLKSFGVDIETQQFHHRKMAYYSSITKRFGTIDFSSASDCVSITLLKELLPPVWFEVLSSVRCKYCLVDGEYIELPMFATMGNATTFPLETLVFYALIVGSIDALEQPGLSSLPQWESLCKGATVFGDDCIVPTEACQLFCLLAEYCGFIVNSEKSFTGEGSFRESCGGDYFAGRNVRPVYMRAPRSRRGSDLRAWLYVLWNTHLKRAISAFGELSYVYHCQHLRFIAKTIVEHNKEFFIVPDDYPDDSGVKLLGDGDRLLRLFLGGRVALLSMNKHGQLAFSCLAFQLRDVEERHDAFYLWRALKFPSTVDFMSARQAPSLYEPVKIGGYVVTKASDSRAFAVWAGVTRAIRDHLPRGETKQLHTA